MNIKKSNPGKNTEYFIQMRIKKKNKTYRSLLEKRKKYYRIISELKR